MVALPLMIIFILSVPASDVPSMQTSNVMSRAIFAPSVNFSCSLSLRESRSGHFEFRCEVHKGHIMKRFPPWLGRCIFSLLVLSLGVGLYLLLPDQPLWTLDVDEY